MFGDCGYSWTLLYYLTHTCTNKINLWSLLVIYWNIWFGTCMLQKPLFVRLLSLTLLKHMPIKHFANCHNVLQLSNGPDRLRFSGGGKKRVNERLFFFLGNRCNRSVALVTSWFHTNTIGNVQMIFPS